MYVVGTAGHIDHGKSTLIKALTGMDPDRLKEEKERGMTIDLGFAWIELPSGRECGIVDVPGHHRFVKNMLAGVGGIDVTVFVVAATESWMPQSQEHLAILDLLGIERGIVVLTKTDLVEPDWLDMVKEDVREHLAGTSLENAPIVAVSAVTGEGMDGFKELMDSMLDEVPERPDQGRPRLWVDRVFSIKGAGTVVTGTLEGGLVHVDDTVLMLPSHVEARVRSLQTHKRSVETAVPGSRVAVNLSGVEKADIQRGHVLVGPGQTETTSLVNGTLRILEDLDFSIPNLSEVKFYVGSAELQGRLRLLDRDELAPGERGYVQIELESPVAVEYKDRFVIRDSARQETVGGGRILDPMAVKVVGQDNRFVRKGLLEQAPFGFLPGIAGVRHDRLNLTTLTARDNAPPVELTDILVRERGLLSRTQAALEVPVPLDQVEERLGVLQERGDVVLLPSFAVSVPAWDDLTARLTGELERFHREHPLRSGRDRETLRSQLELAARFFEEALARWTAAGVVVLKGPRVRLSNHAVGLSRDQEETVAEVMESFAAAPFAPPEYDEIVQRDVDPEIINYLIEAGRLVRVGKGLLFSTDAIDKAKIMVRSVVQDEGQIDLARLRDMLGTTRKFALPLIEYLDQIDFTRRVGDARVLVQQK